MKKVLWISLILLLACGLQKPLQNPDMWFHIVVGRWMLSNFKLPTEDHWNMFAAGTPWHANYWSNEIVYALADRNFGVDGLLALQLAVFLILAFALVYCLGRIAENHFVGSLLGVLASVGCYWHATLRPQTLAWAFFIGTIFICERIRHEGWSYARGLQLTLIMCLWANSHMSTVFGMAAIAIWLMGEWRILLGRTLLFSFIGTFLTPYFGGVWLSAAQKAGHPFQFGLIGELQPATVLHSWTAPLLIATALLLYLCHLKPKSLSPLTLAGWIVFLIGGLASIRFIPFALVLTCALAARVLSEESKVTWGIAAMQQKLQRALQPLVLAVISVAFFALAVSKLVVVWRQPLNLALIPKLAVDFIDANQLPHPILNSFGHGHYLIYRYSDAQGNLQFKVPLDGRTETNRSDVWEKFNAAFLATEQWRDYIELVKPATIMWPTTSPFVRLLTNSNEWCLVYQDGSASGTTVLVTRNFWEKKKETLPSLNCQG